MNTIERRPTTHIISTSLGSVKLPLAAIGGLLARLSWSALVFILAAASIAGALIRMTAAGGGANGGCGFSALPHLGEGSDGDGDGGGGGVLRKIGKCASAKSAINIDTSADCRGRRIRHGCTH